MKRKQHQMRLSDDELAAFERAAALDGRKWSEWLRELGRREAGMGTETKWCSEIGVRWEVVDEDDCAVTSVGTFMYVEGADAAIAELKKSKTYSDVDLRVRRVSA
jgi:hypothetical protein